MSAMIVSGEIEWLGGGYSDENKSLRIYWNPFYTGGLSSGCYESFNLSINYPADNQTFYFPHITPNVTFNLSGVGSPTCRYRFVGYGWNNWTDCGFGGPETNNQLITLPDGENILQINVSGVCASASKQITVTAYYRPGFFMEDEDYSIIGVGFIVVVAYGVYAIARRRKTKW